MADRHNPAARRGRPLKGWKAQTAAERKAEQRARDWEVINTLESEKWNERQCLLVLVASRYRGGAMDRAAWRRLGELRGYT